MNVNTELKRVKKLKKLLKKIKHKLDEIETWIEILSKIEQGLILDTFGASAHYPMLIKNNEKIIKELIKRYEELTENTRPVRG